MKRLFLLFTLLGLSLSSCGQTHTPREDPYLSDFSEISGEVLNMDPALVKWEGRYEYKDNKVFIYHTATGFTVDFYGTSLEVSFYHTNNNIYYNFALDDESLPNPIEDRRFVLPNTEENTTVTLVSGLTNERHTIKCLKMDEAYDGLTAVTALRTDGTFYYRDEEEDNLNYKFMFVCASGGSGFGSLAYTEGSSRLSRTTRNSSSLHSFNYLTARRYEADVMYVATSGWGVKYPNGRSIYDILDCVGNVPANNATAANNQTGSWNKDNYVPDVIIFNIGGNDTTASGFNQATYQNTVIQLVSKLRTYYPNSKMIWTHTNSNAGKYAITALTDAGMMNENLIETIIPKVGEGITGSNTYGAGNHNSLKTHMDAETILVDALSRWGYRPFVDDIVFDDFASMLVTR